MRVNCYAERRSMLAVVSLLGAALVPLGASAQQGLPCAATRIVQITMPTGPARYQGGSMALANGAKLELSGALKSPDMYRVSQMRVGDRVAACYGRTTTYADAGPSRTVTILNLRNGGYYGTLIGNW